MTPSGQPHVEWATPAAQAPAASATIFKPGIAVFTGATAVLGLFLTAAHGDWQVAAGLGLGMTIAAAGAGALNHAFEAERDRRAARTAARPCASGTLAPRHAAAMGAATAVGGTALVAASCGAAAAGFTLLGVLWYAVVYTLWLKPRTWWATPIGGLAGSWAVLAGSAAGGAASAPAALVLAAALAAWSPPHFWALAMARRDDYAAAGVPVLPLVVGNAITARAVFGHTVLTVALLAMLGRAGLGGGYTAAALIATAPWLRAAWRLRRHPDDAALALHAFFYSCTGLAAVLLLATAFSLGGR